MYTLYWAPVTASAAPMAVLEEAGADYELRRVDVDGDQHQSPEHRRLHPYGRIPVLLLADGTPVFESAAIVMTLADRHPDAGLAPGADAPERAAYNQWLFFMADEIYPAFKRVYYPFRFSTEAADADKVKARAMADLMELWRVMDDAIGEEPWLLGARYSACDIYMQMLTTWHPEPAALSAACPNVARVAAAAAARPAVRRALERHETL